MNELTQPLKWHGGKHDLAKWIISLMPPRCKNPNAPSPDDPGWLNYVEPYFGGGSVLLANDPEGISEVANDINSELTNFWRVLQIPDQFEAFTRNMEAMPFSEYEWGGAKVKMADTYPMQSTLKACKFFVVCRQSLAGRMDSFAPLTRQRTRRGMNEQASAWLNCIEGLPAVHARLKRVVILNQPALEVIEKQDGPRTLFYLDPPYLHETRATTGEYGENEMTPDQHSQLMGVLADVKGKFLLSGYPSKFYDDRAKSFAFNRHEREINNHAAGGKTKRKMIECVWCNY